MSNELDQATEIYKSWELEDFMARVTLNLHKAFRPKNCHCGAKLTKSAHVPLCTKCWRETAKAQG